MISEYFDTFIKEQLQQEYMKKLQAFVKKERETKEIYPAPKLVLNAFKMYEYYNLKVVIVGTEPYNIPNTDMGVAFSSIGQHVPKELLEIQQEIRRTEFPYPFKPSTELFRTSNLTQWVEQGVLLINSRLTVEREKPGSHKGQGWELFTIELMKKLNTRQHKLVFMFFGRETWNYRKYITNSHLCIEVEAPGSGKFLGCGCFRTCNEFLAKQQMSIGWHLLH